MRIRRHLVNLFIWIILLMAAVMPVAAREKQNVRVGVFSLGQFQYLDENGQIQGYNGDYLRKIAQINHWSYEYVPVDNWVQGTEYLEEGKIDLLAPAQHIEDLSNRFEFSSYAMGTEYAAIYTKAERTDLLYEDFETMATLKYGGAVNSSFTKKFLEEYSVEAGFVPELTLYANTTELFLALESGEVDAIVTNVMFAQEGIKLLGRFSAFPVYYISWKGNQALLEELDEALLSIRMQNPSYENELMTQYLPVLSDIQFTHAEKQFLQSIGEINIGYPVNQKPIAYLDEDGECAGITREILDKISENLGIAFHYIPIKGSEATYEYLLKNKIYVVASVGHNEEAAENEFISVSEPYLNSEMVFVSKNFIDFGTSSHYKLAFSSTSEILKESIIEAYPNVTYEIYDTVEECFWAVKNGEADALMNDRYIIESVLGNPNFEGFHVVPMQNINNRLSLAIIRFEDANPELWEQYQKHGMITIVNKAIKQISSRQINDIVIKNAVNGRYVVQIDDLLYKYRYLALFLAFLITICVTVFLRVVQIETVRNRKLAEANEQLSEAIVRAEKAGQAKMQFLSRVSHEIRTPMNAIIGITELAKKHKDDTAVIYEYLNKIETSSHILLGIINDVLDMSVIESNKMHILREPFDMREVLEGIAGIYGVQCRNKQIHFQMELELSHEIFMGDSRRITQVLLNLISNAYKFTKPGGSIRVKVCELEKQEQIAQILFCVEDSGRGMTEDMKQRLFIPFEQENHRTAIKYGGSGLGLSIVKNLVDLMHGTIEVQSEEKRGSTFSITIPLEIADKTEIADCPELEDDNLENRFDFTGKRVLIAEDNELNRMIVIELLQMVKITCEYAEDGEKAVRMFEQNGAGYYDLILMDVQMPHLDGYEATKVIRSSAQSDGKTIPIYALTANAFTEGIEQAEHVGMNGHISKPIDTRLLYTTLKKLWES